MNNRCGCHGLILKKVQIAKVCRHRYGCLWVFAHVSLIDCESIDGINWGFFGLAIL